jgi:Immunoglobulin-like domain of bacterial spore germination
MGESSSGGQTRQETTSESGTETTEAPFTAAPEMSGGSEGTADGIREVTFERREGYERAVIVFGSGGGLASGVPVWSLSSPEGEGYARISFPDVAVTLDSDGGFGGTILDNFYVVRAPGGGLFVDLYATGAFQYRVTELSDPGRLVVDYRPASVDLSFPIPVQAQRTVLFEPRAREAITSPLGVSGYSRNPEASNALALVDADGIVLARSTALSNDWLDTWGYFEATLEFPAFEGTATLRVGGESARDGSFEGVEVPVTYGGEGG